jgi:alpha-1,6-mannosyltransferase
VLSAIVFRSELAILLGTSCLYRLFTLQATIDRFIRPFIISAIVSLAISVPVDSYFWQRPLWPELWGFYYNAILGSSSNWGTSPWHYYFTSALPRLLNPLSLFGLIPFALLHPGTRNAAQGLIIPSLSFVAIYSFQPHKEARFIFYVVPPLTAAAALGANLVFSRRSKSVQYAIGSLAIIASVLLSLATSTGMLMLSSLNYPGGEALSELYKIVSQESGTVNIVTVTSVHTDVLSCMTGVTLFGQNPGGLPLAVDPRSRRARDGSVMFEFDKTEDAATLLDPMFWSRFDYVLAEDVAAIRGGEWEAAGVVQGYAGIEFLKPSKLRSSDIEPGVEASKIVGKGAYISSVKELVRKFTGGWWVGPRMAPRIQILKRVKDRTQQVRKVSK